MNSMFKKRRERPGDYVWRESVLCVLGYALATAPIRPASQCRACVDAMAAATVRRREQYDLKGKVGKGTFGEVWKAVARSTGQVVAIKEIKQQKGRDGVDQSAIDEIRLMQETRHPNILALHEVFQGREGTLSLVLDFIQTDLDKIVKAKDMTQEPFVPMPPDEIKAYMQMFLSGVSYCHGNYILHRDLKPANLLVGADGVLKLCDFGLARTYGSPNAKYSPQAITKWYKPMEMLLGSTKYGPACDMWGVGCIFGEMLLRAPLFATDQHASDLDQIQRISELMGSPDGKSWPDMEHLPVTVKFKLRHPAPFSTVFPAASKEALDLLNQLLRYDPSSRISAASALDHPYFSASQPPAPIERIAARVQKIIDCSQQQKAASEGGATAGMKRKAADSPIPG